MNMKQKQLSKDTMEAIKLLEKMLDLIRPENTSELASYEFNAEHSQLIESTADQVLDQLKILKARISL